MRDKHLKFFLVLIAFLTFGPLAYLGPTTQDDNTWLLVFNEISNSNTPFRDYFQYTVKYAQQQGRLGFFISFPLISFPYLFTSTFVGSLIKLSSLLFLTFSIYKTVEHFANSIQASLAVIIFTCLHTLSWYHNGFVSYSIQFFLLISSFLFSLILFDRYVQTSRVAYLIGAAFLYLLSLSIEIFFVLFPAYFLVVILRTSRGSIFGFILQPKILLGYGLLLLTGVLYFFGYYAFRSNFESTYIGNQIAENFTFSKYFFTNFKMSLAAFPGIVPFFDKKELDLASLFSANGIIYSIASFFVLPLLVIIRNMTNQVLIKKQFMNSLNLCWFRRFACLILAVYLFIATTSLPSLTSMYQSILIEHRQWGYIYTFLSFVVLALFLPGLILIAMKAKPLIFWLVAISLSILALIGRGYSQIVFDEMFFASKRWSQFEQVLKSEISLQQMGCLRSDSLFRPNFLIDVTDDYWTRFVSTRKPGQFIGTKFIRDGKNYGDCIGSTGRFEFLYDSDSRYLGWYIVTPEIDGKNRQLLIFIDRPTPLFVIGPTALRDQAGNVSIPDQSKAIAINPMVKQAVKYSMVGDDVSVQSSGFRSGQILRMISGFYPAEQATDGGIFWWARGSSSFAINTDPLSLPQSLVMRLYIVPVGAKPGQELTLQCNNSSIITKIIGSEPQLPIEIDISGSFLRSCQTFRLIPNWLDVRLSAGDSRSFSFKLAQVRFYLGEFK